MAITFLLSYYLACPPPNASSLEFNRIQTEWVALQATQFQVDRGIPQIVKMLGAPNYKVRVFSQWVLNQASSRYVYELHLAQRNRDPEIRYRATDAIKRAFCCRICGGSGVCPKCRDREPSIVCECNEAHGCLACDGSGDIRLIYSHASFDDGDVYKQRKLFDAKVD